MTNVDKSKLPNITNSVRILFLISIATRVRQVRPYEQLAAAMADV